MFSCYLKLERDHSPKKGGGLRKTPLYEVTVHEGYFEPLEGLKNPKGKIVMYLQRNDKCNPNSTSEQRLQCKGGVNFSSIYFNSLRVGESLVGYGEPPRSEVFKNGKVNPFRFNREDGYLFIVSPDREVIEILVVPGERMMICGYAARLGGGLFDDILSRMRGGLNTCV